MSSTAHPDSNLPAHLPIAVDDLVAGVSDTEILQVLGTTKEDLVLARSDSDLLETLRITYEFVSVLRESGVLEIFARLDKPDQADFLRLVAMTADRALRVGRMKILALALQESPLGSGTPTLDRVRGDAH